MKAISSLLPFLPFSHHAADPGLLVMLLYAKNTSNRVTSKKIQRSKLKVNNYIG
jgi:hypothetical protein